MSQSGTGTNATLAVFNPPKPLKAHLNPNPQWPFWLRSVAAYQPPPGPNVALSAQSLTGTQTTAILFVLIASLQSVSQTGTETTANLTVNIPLVSQSRSGTKTIATLSFAIPLVSQSKTGTTTSVSLTAGDAIVYTDKPGFIGDEEDAVFRPAPTGQIIFSGTTILTDTDSPTGELVISGSQTESKTGSAATTGTLVLSGSSTQARIGSDSPSGSLLLSGSVSEDYYQHFASDTDVGTLLFSGSISERRSAGDLPFGQLFVSKEPLELTFSGRIVEHYSTTGIRQKVATIPENIPRRHLKGRSGVRRSRR